MPRFIIITRWFLLSEYWLKLIDLSGALSCWLISFYEFSSFMALNDWFFVKSSVH